MDAAQSKVDHGLDKCFKDEDNTTSLKGTDRTISDDSENFRNIKLGSEKDIDQGDPVSSDNHEFNDTQGLLDDALRYLDVIKVTTADDPRIYNRFLNIMADFKKGEIDTLGVIERVSILFACNTTLVQSFNVFLPPGYRIECKIHGDEEAIRVKIPGGAVMVCRSSDLRTASGKRVINVDDEKSWVRSDSDSGVWSD